MRGLPDLLAERPVSFITLDNGEPRNLFAPKGVKQWAWLGDNSEALNHVVKFNTDNYNAKNTGYHKLLKADLPLWRTAVLLEKGEHVGLTLLSFADDVGTVFLLRDIGKGVVRLVGGIAPSRSSSGRLVFSSGSGGASGIDPQRRITNARELVTALEELAD